jgi:hypothetical protein
MIPILNGIGVFSGTTSVQAINCGDLAGGTVTRERGHPTRAPRLWNVGEPPTFIQRPH